MNYKIYTKEKGIIETNNLTDEIRKLTYHREDGPAEIEYYKNGQKEYEAWYLNNKQHRKDGPAIIGYYNENGLKEYEAWYLNDKYHREDGPAFISYDLNDKIIFESYWQNGNRHRLDGPAVIDYHNPRCFEYWISGVKYSKTNYEKEIRKIKWQNI